MPKTKAGDHFESLFEYAPISLWEQDYSGIKSFLDKLRASGVANLDTFLNEHPEEIDKTLRLIKVTHVNRETLNLFGAKTEKELLANLDKMFRDEMRAHWRSELTALWNGEFNWSGDGVNYRLDGEALDIRLHWRILPECESTWECVLVAIENITALKQAEKRFRNLFEYAPISLWEEDYSAIKKEFDSLRAQGVTDLRTHLSSDTQSVRRFMGMIRVLDVNRKTLSLFEAMDKDSLLANLGKIFRDSMGEHFKNELVDMWEGKTYYEREGINYSLTGESVNVHLHWTLMPGHENDFDWVLVALQDVTARKKAEEYLRYLGTHDVMTGLYNRAFFEETLQDLEASRKDPISFIIVDLNGLKLANDSFGHSAGDKLIRRTAEVLKASIENGTIPVRIGGDEFILIMPGANEQAAKDMVERVESLMAMNNKYYREPELSVSIGASTSAPGFSLLKFISLADDEMYKNKGIHHRRRRDDA
ncbi:MAG TPA: GGDEF domain-containing protein [Anaerolineales bacterium]|jgi:diguanylate cyclase (GGDEF)-like protein|nr:GGDEF domain-containing protein [Anaerolineales bacterium]HQX16373.1 GGDEF domain-containing protein [Anaerolineales bacterium]